MKAELNRHCKCICSPKNPDQWRVIREMDRCCVILCLSCRQSWYTSARYVSELERRIASPYRWRQIVKSEGYHMREDGVDYDADFDPSAKS